MVMVHSVPLFIFELTSIFPRNYQRTQERLESMVMVIRFSTIPHKIKSLRHTYVYLVIFALINVCVYRLNL